MTTKTDPDISTDRSIGQFLEGYATEQLPKDHEMRRRYPRLSLGESVDVMIDSSERPAEVLTATGRDICMGGIGIYSHRSIPPGTDLVVSVENGTDRFLGRAVTVHSTMSVGLFKIGARFVDA